MVSSYIWQFVIGRTLGANILLRNNFQADYAFWTGG